MKYYEAVYESVDTGPDHQQQQLSIFGVDGETELAIVISHFMDALKIVHHAFFLYPHNPGFSKKIHKLGLYKGDVITHTLSFIETDYASYKNYVENTPSVIVNGEQYLDDDYGPIVQ